MQKNFLLSLFILMFFVACNSAGNTENTVNEAVVTEAAEKVSIPMFPVTEYLKGQISEIEKMPVTPLLTSGAEGEIDSVWLPREELMKYAGPFLSPQIDSSSLKDFYVGHSFLDETINSVTFVYNVLPGAPDSAFSEINVYINPETNKVDRIYLVKETNNGMQQLTWKAGHWLSIREVEGDHIREERIKWNFDE